LRAAAPAGALLQACLFPGLEEEIVVYQAQRLAERIVRRSVAAGIAGAFYLKEVLPRGGVREAVGRDDRDLRGALPRDVASQAVRHQEYSPLGIHPVAVFVAVAQPPGIRGGPGDPWKLRHGALRRRA